MCIHIGNEQNRHVYKIDLNKCFERLEKATLKHIFFNSCTMIDMIKSRKTHNVTSGKCANLYITMRRNNRLLRAFSGQKLKVTSDSWKVKTHFTTRKRLEFYLVKRSTYPSNIQKRYLSEQKGNKETKRERDKKWK